ncbi:UDP-3-O-(3-hydroxymyristoyl)glucosamine N-acyltransferase [Cyanobium sp. WAJ14-Wanaka]|uniref:UDP-3-O-(3-hydroxymyristoyl)glucosamine N-acyltransferase n=1 Tax=Cyanobium sp. WAJ14-Wanaka TaxID=2823725 RepID=UPI0020CF3013|nr:UDP-3-O-(3-hydroxymyristoyl)glucosamine N-acyltransferase [Cyanobium sp. WAJ14-Wanaka]MCP9774434.1 UDP-3-O-(3-hydroxymyristoyl)glucosamine N-acyltransferase [Cyanobium sp. WAJ14-Wanaka]
MRFSDLLAHLGEVGDASPRDLGSDPELVGAQALDQAVAGQLGFLERGNALAAALEGTKAGAVLLPLDPELQSQASAQGLAWVALKDPRLGFAEALDALYPRQPKAPGIDATAVVAASALVSPTAHIGARVVIGEHCQIAEGCILHPGAILYEDVQLGPACEIHSGAVLHPGSRLAAQCVVHSNAVIGSEGFGFVPTAQGWRKMPQTGLVVLEEAVEVGCGTTIDRPSVGETRIGAGSKIDNLVQIGHGVVTGRGCALASQVGIAGGAKLGNGVILAGQVGVANRAVIGDRAIASSKSGIHGEVAPGEVVSGYPAIPNRLWLRCSATFNKLPEMAKSLRQLQARQG